MRVWLCGHVLFTARVDARILVDGVLVADARGVDEVAQERRAVCLDKDGVGIDGIVRKAQRVHFRECRRQTAK